MQHALEARNVLEPPLARLAAQRVTPTTLNVIREFLHLMEHEPSGEPEMLIDYDSGFHVSIARATGNPTLVHMVSALADALASTRVLSLHAPGGVATSIAGHQAIVAAISDRDGDRAQAAMQEHLDDVTRLVRLNASRTGETAGRESPRPDAVAL